MSLIKAWIFGKEVIKEIRIRRRPDFIAGAICLDFTYVESGSFCWRAERKKREKKKVGWELDVYVSLGTYVKWPKFGTVGGRTQKTKIK